MRQQHAAQHLDHAHDDPARPAHHHTGPPLHASLRLFRGHEAQVVGLLAHLCNQRNAHGQRRTKQVPLEGTPLPICPGIVHHLGKHTRVQHRDGHKGNDHHDQPQRLRPHLKTADHRHPVRDQRNHHHRTDEVAPGQRNAQRQLQRVGHDGRFQRKKDEGERRVNQRGDGGADVAKPGATGQQVHVHPVAGGIDADGQSRHKNQQARRQDGPERIQKTILHQQRRAHGFQDQERSHPECRIRHPPL